MDAAWASLWVLRRRHAAPAWARMLVAASLGGLLAIALMTFIALFGVVEYPNWWWIGMLPSMLICMGIALTLVATLRVAEMSLPEAMLAQMSESPDWRSSLLLAAIAMAAIMLGVTISFSAIPPLFGLELWTSFRSAPVAGIKISTFLLLLASANWAWWSARARRQQLQRGALEAQLRLLQAQIEPHFLFNTLANVQSLMDSDPARAKQMLEAFSDYLRAGLAQLRQTDSTVGAELAMAQTYLELLQIRMEDRLGFSIEASEEARAARLPTLLLQPLVENAIRHGLEPKVEGGTVRLLALVRDGRLEVRVQDDGMGLDAPRRTLHGGTGMALANLRARLHSRYGDGASLTLSPLAIGAQAVLDLPHKAHP